ncbi:hypothetical protein EGH24_09320 [Halonotius terrestris]|uniref:Uncharacterized protein n=1 Tax=Halonotius terrestris TaxID=2487750 RepID=A0A8J8P9N9_9EURY|nr:hypothetical protein [Halonotius terrestris]TQQ81311.1 hypothetical protein EGH24_09320 [Halonotius terrestris]
MAESESAPDDEPADEATDAFAALTLKERIAVATAQDPTKAMAVLVLFLFALAFFVALVLAFPGVAVLFVLGTLVLAGLAVAGYVFLTRVEN